MTIIVDTNVWIAAHVSDEPHYHQSRAWLYHNLSRGERTAAPRILLLEIPAALERTSKAAYRSVIVKELNRVGIRWTPVDDTLIDRPIEITTDLRLKSLDCLYVATAEQ